MCCKKRVIGLVGPTASGKTALSLLAAKALGGQIVCMDSMQVYQGMDIGTAKPTKEEQALCPHYMLDLLSPDEPYSVSKYGEDARKLLDSLPTPILVGGTGMYLQALSLPMDYGAAPGDEAIRAKYHALADEQGPEALHALLAKGDPVTAARLHPNDIKRVVRALEVLEITGLPLSAQKMPGPESCPYDFQLYALDLPRALLYDRINQRVDQMMKEGLLHEVESLLKKGISPEAQAMQGLGYKELVPVLQGKIPLQDGVELLKLRTRHFAKRQLTWFKKDQRICWFPWDEKAGTAQLAPMAQTICQNYLQK